MLFDFPLDGTSFFVMIFSLTIESILQVGWFGTPSGLGWEGVHLQWLWVGGVGKQRERGERLGGRCVTTVAIRTNCITTTCPWIESCEHDLQEKRGWSRTALWSQIDHSCDYRGGSQGVLLM
jgi:hypothetical protein